MIMIDEPKVGIHLVPLCLLHLLRFRHTMMASLIDTSLAAPLITRKLEDYKLVKMVSQSINQDLDQVTQNCLKSRIILKDRRELSPFILAQSGEVARP